MTNRFRGEVSVNVDGKAYTLRADMNFLHRVEELFDKPALDVFDDLEKSGSIRGIMQVLHCALAKYHPEADMDVAGDIASEDMSILGRLLEAASPEKKEASGN